jgi:hypothetical protein
MSRSEANVAFIDSPRLQRDSTHTAPPWYNLLSLYIITKNI